MRAALYPLLLFQLALAVLTGNFVAGWRRWTLTPPSSYPGSRDAYFLASMTRTDALIYSGIFAVLWVVGICLYFRARRHSTSVSDQSRLRMPPGHVEFGVLLAIPLATALTTYLNVVAKP